MPSPLPPTKPAPSACHGVGRGLCLLLCDKRGNVRDGSTPCCRPLIACSQRRARLSTTTQSGVYFIVDWLGWLCYFAYICPSPPMSAVISSIFSNGKGGWESGFIAIDISFIGLSSAATRLELKCPHLRQRWMIAHSPFFLTHTPTGSMIPPQSASLSPGSMSKCKLLRQLGQ